MKRKELPNVCYIISMLKETEHTLRYVDMFKKSVETLTTFYHVDNLFVLVSFNQDSKKACDSLIIKLSGDLEKTGNVDNIWIKGVDIDIADNLKFPNNIHNAKRIDKTAMLKFFIPYKIEADDVWYFDCDLLFNGNLADTLWEGIKEDTLFKFYRHDNISHINSGLIYMNCKMYRDINVMKDVEIFYRSFTDSVYVDQGCFNFLTKWRNKDNIVIHESKGTNVNILPKDMDTKKPNKAVYHVFGPDKGLFNKMYDVIMKSETNNV